MHLRDLSLKTKLLLTNALMVVIPICVLVAIGAVLLGGLRHAGTLQQQALELLWPERGTNLSVPLALSSLRAAAERKQFKWNHVERDVHLLESAGVRVSIVQDGLLYLTDGADAEDIRYAVMRACGARGSALTWNEAGVFFRYEGERNGIIFMGAGAVPMMRHHDEMRISPPMRETVINAVFIFFIVITSAGIFLLGRYLARLLSAQILAPLAAMRDAAGAMQHGDFDHALPPTGSDEGGATAVVREVVLRLLQVLSLEDAGVRLEEAAPPLGTQEVADLRTDEGRDNDEEDEGAHDANRPSGFQG